MSKITSFFRAMRIKKGYNIKSYIFKGERTWILVKEHTGNS